jgi:thymidine kinase
MFSGKTEALIKRAYQTEKVYGLKAVVFKPFADTRHQQAEVISHNGTSIPAKWLAKDAPNLPHDVGLIAIDEVQFLSLDAVPRIMEAVNAGVMVMVAGLDLTSKGEPFGPVPALMALADSVVKLVSRCAKCSTPANRSQRLVVSSETVLVGGTESYEPRCLSCFDPKGGS